MCCRNFSDAAAPVYILPCRGAETQNARAMGILSPCNMNAAHRARAGAVTIALSRVVSNSVRDLGAPEDNVLQRWGGAIFSCTAGPLTAGEVLHFCSPEDLGAGLLGQTGC